MECQTKFHCMHVQQSNKKISRFKKGSNPIFFRWSFNQPFSEEINPFQKVSQIARKVIHCGICHPFPSLGIWQYELWSFQMGDTKLDRFLLKNQHTQRNSLNFEFWINGELSKIGHHFRSKVF